jgi:hypothetical protein
MTQLLKWSLVLCLLLGKGELFLKGAGASPLGGHPFLDLMDFGDGDEITSLEMQGSESGRIILEAASLEMGFKALMNCQHVNESLLTLMEDNNTICIRSYDSKTIPHNYLLPLEPGYLLITY